MYAVLRPQIWLKRRRPPDFTPSFDFETPFSLSRSQFVTRCLATSSASFTQLFACLRTTFFRRYPTSLLSER